MPRPLCGLLLLLASLAFTQAQAQSDEPDSIIQSTVQVGGQPLHYKAIAGTITAGSTNEVDALLGQDGHWLLNSGVKPPTDPETAPATARIFYAAYFRTDSPDKKPRPVVFLYNDLGTPFFSAQYEMEHLPIPTSLQQNIDYRFYPTGHMIYLNEDALHRLHDDVAKFIRATEVPR